MTSQTTRESSSNRYPRKCKYSLPARAQIRSPGLNPLNQRSGVHDQDNLHTGPGHNQNPTPGSSTPPQQYPVARVQSPLAPRSQQAASNQAKPLLLVRPQQQQPEGPTVEKRKKKTQTHAPNKPLDTPEPQAHVRTGPLNNSVKKLETDADFIEMFPELKASFEENAHRLRILDEELADITKPLVLTKPDPLPVFLPSGLRKSPSPPVLPRSIELEGLDQFIKKVNDMEVLQDSLDKSPPSVKSGTAAIAIAEWKSLRAQKQRDVGTSPLPEKRKLSLPVQQPVNQTSSFLDTPSKRRRVERHNPYSVGGTEPGPSTASFGLFQERFGVRAGRPNFLSHYPSSRHLDARYDTEFGSSLSPFTSSPGASTIVSRFDRESDPTAHLTNFPEFAKRTPVSQAVRREEDNDDEDDGLYGGFDPARNLGDDFSTLFGSDPHQEDPRDDSVHGAQSPGLDDRASPVDDESNSLDGQDAPPTASNITARRSSRITSTTNVLPPRRRGKQRRGPPKLHLSLTRLPLFLYVPTGNGSQLRPISDLPASAKSWLEAALDGIYNANPKRAATATRPSNSKTYVDSGTCMGTFIIKCRRSQAPRSTSCEPCTSLLGHFMSGGYSSSDRGIWS